MSYVLIVDDHPVNIKLMEFTLGVHNIPTRIARNAEETYAVVADECPQVILMDVQLPGTDGLTITRRLREDPRFQTVPIVAVTAYAMASDEEAARDAGCDDFVAKPIDTVALGQLVLRLIEKGRPA